MTKQMKAAMAAMLMIGTLPMMAQTSQTDVVKVAPGQTKKTVIHRKNGATDTVISEGTTRSAKRHTKRHTVHSTRRAAVHHEPTESATSREIRELREKQAAQQAEIDALSQANTAKDAALAQAQSAAAGAEAQAQAATAASQNVNANVQANADAVQQLKGNVSDLTNINAGLAQTITANKVELTEKIDNPLVLHYKGVTITPVAFFALEAVYRQRAINSGLNTPSMRLLFQDRTKDTSARPTSPDGRAALGGLFEGNAGTYKLSGYFEADFLSAGVTSNSNQSNSYTLRQRQIWAKAETKTGFAVTGGQMWSLVTENGKSTDVRTEKLPNTIDPQYMVGYNWARQPALRIQQKFGNPFLGAATTLAISLENAQTQFAASNAPGNFIFGGAGTGGGLYNPTANYANSVAPDVMAKIAFDSKHNHTEIGGMARFFRDEYYPLTITNTATGNVTTYSNNLQKNTKVGGGAFGTTRFITKFVEIAAQGMFGDGTGRYGSSQLGDVTAHPDGTLEPLHNYHGLFTLETHPSKKLDVYAYYGAEYNQRTYYVTPLTGALVGYGVPNQNDSGCFALTPPAVSTGGSGVTGTPATTNCGSPTRSIQEGTIGYTYKIVSTPKYGTLRYQLTYSYLQRSSWMGLQSGTFGTGNAVFVNPRATNNLVYGGLRYYIP